MMSMFEKKIKVRPLFFITRALDKHKNKNTSVRKKAKAPNNQMYKSYFVDDPKLQFCKR